jgi:hypothetical protein
VVVRVKLGSNRKLFDFRFKITNTQSSAKQVAEVAPWLPPDYADMKLRALAHDETLRLAWDVRHVNPQQAAVDLAVVTHTLKQLQADPNANPAEIKQLTTLARQLDAAMRSPAILRNARNQILAEAKKLKPPYDPEASQIRDDVAWAVRQAQHGDIPEPPVNLGQLTDAEYRNYLRKNFNISGF